MKYTRDKNMSEVKLGEQRIPSIAVNLKVLAIYSISENNLSYGT